MASFEHLRAGIVGLEAEIRNNQEKVDAKIDADQEKLEARIDANNEKI
jgi:hypothetical protein